MKIQEASKIITEYMGFKDFTEEELGFQRREHLWKKIKSRLES